MPLVKDLIFKDAYVDAARTKILSDGSMNYVVEMYDTALKETISKLKQADKLVRVKYTVLNRRTSEFKATIDKAVAEQSRLLAEKKAQKDKFVEKFGELKGNRFEPGSSRSQPRGERRAIDDENPTLPLGEDGIGLDPEDLVELSDSSAEEDGGDKSNEQVPASNPQGTEEDLEESSAKEQGNVDGVENPPDSTKDGIRGASDPLAAQVIGGDLDCAED
ncbi:hypothetical protein F2Q68_00043399 [Brassica cretica]|uniref:Uncharacterized protein n=1 Tax=Brassica cretica TaxID=69181 RepID=A0A8S9LJQ1_BRACR|nr:hypothetical protein F2Q68_00043399 [Brassica cretica]